MKKLGFLALVVLLLVVCAIGVSATTAVGNGNTDVLSAYEQAEIPDGAIAVNTPLDFAAMEPDGVYYLNADITLTASYGEFSGKLYGNGHTVTVLSPVFEKLSGAEIYDLTIEGEISLIADLAGGLAIQAYNSTVVGITNKATVAACGPNVGWNIVGGVLGVAENTTVRYCVNYGAITGGTYNNGEARPGGIVGEINNANAWLVIENCVNYGNINGVNQTGGILARAQNCASITIRNCVNYGTVYVHSSDSGSIAGKIVCNGVATLENCINSGILDGGSQVGMVGYGDCQELYFTNCHNGCFLGCDSACDHGKVTSRSGNKGAILGGYNASARTNSVLYFKDCSNTAELSGPATTAGIAANITAANITFENCYNSGSVSGNGAIGGISASLAATNVTYKNCSNVGHIKTTNGVGGGITAYCHATGVATFENCFNGCPYGCTTSCNHGKVECTSHGAGILGNRSAKDGSAYFSNCTNTGRIVCGGSSSGGIAGWINGVTISFENCYNGCANGCASCDHGVVTMTAANNLGGIVGCVNGSGESQNLIVKDCFNNADLGSGRTGGIVGGCWVSVSLLIENCTNLGNITSTSNMDAGGIIALQDNAAATSIVIANCVNYGNITTTHNDARPGGIIGPAKAANLTITNCTNYGEIKAEGYGAGIVSRVQIPGKTRLTSVVNYGDCSSVRQYVSGIMGWTTGTTDITCIDVHNKGNMTCLNGTVGGILGNWSSTGITALYFENCSNTGTLQGTAAQHYAGIVLHANQTSTLVNATFKNCYNTASFTSSIYNAAGIVGILGAQNVVFENCSNSGDMTITSATTEDSGAAGIVGYVNGTNLTIKNCSNTGNMSAYDGNAAGIIGRSNATGDVLFKSCTNSGSCAITCATRGVNGEGKARDHMAGGIAGVVANTSKTITYEDCHNGCFSGCTTNCDHGKVTNASTLAGGMQGYTYGGIAKMVIRNCTNSGKIHGHMEAGGIVARVNVTHLTIENCSNGCFNGCTPAEGEYCTHGMITNTSKQDFGGIVAAADHGNCVSIIIKNCYNNGRMDGQNRGGGITGVLSSKSILLQGNVNEGDVEAHQNYSAAMFGRIDNKAKAEDQTVDIIDCVNYGKLYQPKNYGGGFIGYVGTAGKITLVNSHNYGEVHTGWYAAGLLSNMSSVYSITLIDCSNTGTIKSQQCTYTGGLIAGSWADRLYVYNCINSGDVISGLAGATKQNTAAGGLAGYLANIVDLVIENCTNEGDVDSNDGKGIVFVGGLIGQTYGSNYLIKNCVNKGEITGHSADKRWNTSLDPDAYDSYICSVGGFIGSTYASVRIENCTNEGTINATCVEDQWDIAAAGFIGAVHDNVTVVVRSCDNSGEITCDRGAAAGMIGFLYDAGKGMVSVIDCINYSDITANSRYATGGIGYAYKSFEMIRCENRGELSAPNSPGVAGGLLARKNANSANSSVSFVDCINTGDVSAHAQAGGMAAAIDSYSFLNVINCKNTGELKTLTTNNSGVGGMAGTLAGSNSGDALFVGCINEGNVSDNGKKGRIGGLLGVVENGTTGCMGNITFRDCTNKGTVTSAGNYAGGIICRIDFATGGKTLTMDNCLNEGDVYAKTNHNGGLIGLLDLNDSNAIFRNCVNTGDITVTSGGQAGGIAGLLNKGGTHIFENCSNSGTLSGANNLAGIVAYDNGNTLTITNCTNTGKITAQTESGGIVGCSNASVAVTITNCINKAAVDYSKADGNAAVGGIVGRLYGAGAALIENCTNEGTIGRVIKVRDGGILGVSDKASVTFRNCLNKGDVITNHYAGGIVCRMDFAAGNKVVFENCVNEGNVTGGGTGNAGIFAWCEDNTDSYSIEFYNCSNSGNITANSGGSGGIMGYINQTKGTLIFKNCTNTGKINNKTGGVAGGILGASNSKVTMENCVNRGTVEMTKSGNVAGIAGGMYANGTVENYFTGCSNFGKIVGSTDGSDTWSMVGGFVGHSAVSLIFNNCYNGCDKGCTTECDHGRITGNNKVNFAGFVAKMERATDRKLILTMNNCVNDGAIGTTSVRQTVAAAGLVAEAQGYHSDLIINITNCTNNGHLYAAGGAVGGIIGTNFGNNTISNCENNGGFTVTSANVGGIVGRQGSTGVNLINCVNNANITTTGNAGGLVGECHGDDNIAHHKITNSTNNGNVTAVYAGGLIPFIRQPLTVDGGHNTGNITGSTAAGGLVGAGYHNGNYNKSITFKNSTNSGAIKSTGADGAGGLMALFYTDVDNASMSQGINLTIENCHNSGSVTWERAEQNINYGLGGLVSVVNTKVNSLTIKNSSNSGTLSVTITTRGEGCKQFGIGGAIGYIPTECCWHFTTDTTVGRTVEVSAITIDGFTNSATINCTGHDYVVGGALGYVLPTGDLTLSISNSVNKGNITSKNRALGGLVGCVAATGANTITFTNCTNSGTITSTAGNVPVGGIYGGVEDTTKAYDDTLTMTNCLNTGNVTSSGRPGGILGVVVGTNEITIKNCTNTGKVDSNGNYAGGIASRIDVKTTWLEGCVNYGTVETHQSQVGGIVGYMSVDYLTRADMTATIKNCENHGDVTIGNTSNGPFFGGIVGQYNAGELLMVGCINYGTVGNPTANSGGIWAGGMIGKIANLNVSIELKNCVNYGTIVANSTATGNTQVEAGGIVAQSHTTGTKITDCTNYGKVSANGGQWGTGVAAGMMATSRTTASTVFTNCVNYGEITANTAKGGAAGGMLGYSHNTAGNDPSFDGCINYGKVSANAYAGGILAYLYQQATFEDCENHGEIVSYAPELEANNGNGAGGILCRGDCSSSGAVTFINCVNTGKLKSGAYAGGILADVDDVTLTFTNCINTGDIETTGNAAGILACYNMTIDALTATFTNCVNTGDITTNSYAGGIVGNGKSKCVIKNCVSTGDVTGDTQVGGIVGCLNGNGKAQYSEITYCYVSGTITHKGGTAGGSNAVGGLAGYGWGAQYFTYNVIEADVVLKWTNTSGKSGQDLPCAAVIAGYVNNGSEKFNYNFFTGTLDAGDGIAAYLGQTRNGGSTYKEPGATNLNANIHHNYAMTDVVYPLVFATKVDSTKGIGQPIQIATNTSAANVASTLGSSFKVVNGTVVPANAETAFKAAGSTTAPTIPSAHTHSYATSLSKDATGHWYECSCGATKDFAAHTYTGGCDTTCDCGYTRTLANPAHTYTDVCDTTCNSCNATRTVDANAHVYSNACDTTCDNCGATRTVSNPAHVYTDACDTTCDNCGATRTVEASAHVYSGSCDATCNNCGATRTVSNPIHAYDSVTDTTCNNCGATRTSATCVHVYTNACDATCNACGATRTVEASVHVYSDACDTTCNVCDATRTVNSHVYSGDCDASCNVCGATRTATGTHAGQHTCSSTCKVCGAAVTPGAHTYANSCDTACDKCGAERTEGLVHEAAYACATECKYCRAPMTASGDHVYTNTCDKTCDKCGEIRTVAADSHAYSSTCDVSCNNCGYVRAESELVHTNNTEVPCDTACTVCGKTIAALQPHTGAYSCATQCQWCDAEVTPGLHTPEKACSEVCKDCGAAVPVEQAHTFANDCDADCDLCGKTRTDLKHTFAHSCDAVCEYCDYTRPASELVHVYSNTCDAECNNGCGHVRAESELRHVAAYPCATQCANCSTAIEAGAHTAEHACSTDCFYCGTTLENPADHTYTGHCDVYCDVCGAERSTDEAPHQYHSDCDTTCNICGYVRNQVVEHARVYECSTGCMYCGEELSGAMPHAYATACDDTCDVCGHVRTFAEGLVNHAYDNNCDADCNYGCGTVRPVGGHKGQYPCSTECKHCGAEIEGKAHTYNNVCSDTCAYCGEVTRTVDSHVGEYACSETCKLCGATIVGESHSFENACDDTCNVCGATRTVGEHVAKFVCSTECDVCGVAIEGVAHTYANACDNTCDECGATRVPAAHEYDSGCDVDCNVCGMERLELTHTYDNACDANCNVCDAERSVGSHSYGSWIVTKPATVEETGLKTRTCAYCGHVDEKEIDKLEPTEEDPSEDENEGEQGGSNSGSDNGSDSGNSSDNDSNAPSTDDTTATEESSNTVVIIAVIAAAALVIIVIIAIAAKGKKAKKSKKNGKKSNTKGKKSK